MRGHALACRTASDTAASRLRRKISVPYAELSASLARFGRLQRASDLARRASRFVTLVRRLDVQMADYEAAQAGGDEARERGDRALGEAALTLAEIGALRREASCRRSSC